MDNKKPQQPHPIERQPSSKDREIQECQAKILALEVRLDSALRTVGLQEDTLATLRTHAADLRTENTKLRRNWLQQLWDWLRQ